MRTMADVRHLHLELSSQCNARCGRCPRNTFGFPYQPGYQESNISLDMIKQTLSEAFLSHIDRIQINGNYGDFVMNPESLEIVRYLRQHMTPYETEAENTGLIEISTNGSARAVAFWQNLGSMTGIKVLFCIDGLQDTHHRYRQDTDFDMILRNASAYLAAGGQAVWVFTQFPYNEHQIPEARAISQSLGFQDFRVRLNDRADGPIYDRDGNTVWRIGHGNPNNLPQKMTKELADDRVMGLERQSRFTDITCKAMKQKSLYVGASGRIMPCCWTDLWQPRTQQDMSRDQHLSRLLPRYERPLNDSDEWFPQLVQSWSSAEQSATCQNFCGA